MKKFLSLILCATSMMAYAQTSTLTGTYAAVTEFSTSVDKVDASAFSSALKMTWNNVNKREGVTVKVLDGLDKDGKTIANNWVVFQGSAAFTPTFDRATMMFFPFAMAKAGTLDTKFIGSVENGKKWASKYTIVSNPATWCPSTLDTDLKADNTVGEKETYELVIDGTKTTLNVFPIYENGWWQRCVSGRAIRKFLYSPELNTHVSVEWVQYRSAPNNMDVAVSQMFRLLELKKIN